MHETLKSERASSRRSEFDVLLFDVDGTIAEQGESASDRCIQFIDDLLAAGCGVGLVTALKEAQDNSALNVRRDQAKPVFKQLASSHAYGWVLFNNSLLAASALTESSMPQLWSPNMHIYGGIDEKEKVERYYQYLYLLGVSPQTFTNDLQNKPQVRVAVFGLPRVNTLLSKNPAPISDAEIRAHVEAYTSYVNNFSAFQASRWPLVYVITIGDHDFTNLDRWYTRSSGEPFGESVVYRVQLKQ